MAGIASASVSVRHADAFQASGQYAATVIGQGNFTSRIAGLSPQNLYQPFRPTFDSSGDLWVGDEADHRVVEFMPPLTDGEPASLEIGELNFAEGATNGSLPASQDTLFGPVAVAFDKSGDLWVADFVYNRVTEYKPPFEDGMNASLELGQPAGSSQFTKHPAQSPSMGLNAPVALAFDSAGDLWVVDRGNNRLVEYAPPFVSGQTPSLVVGQPSLNSSAGATTQSGLNGPESAAFDSSGNLWVVDEGNDRVLEYGNSSLESDGPRAVLELGQRAGPGEFVSNGSEVSRSTFGAPMGVAVSPWGDLLVSDRSGNRILGFEPPFSDGMNASYEIGQHAGPSQFAAAPASVTQNGLHNPLGLAFDPSGNVWVADQLNARVLEFSSLAAVTSGTDVSATATGASDNESSTTGLSMSVKETSSASVNFYSAKLSAQPPGSGTLPLSGSRVFYQAKVSGGSGDVAICVRDPRASNSTSMMFFDGASWIGAGDLKATSGGSICGDVPSATLSSLTLLAVTEAPGPPLASPLLQAAALLAAAVAFGTISYIVLKTRPAGSKTGQRREILV